MTEKQIERKIEEERELMDIYRDDLIEKEYEEEQYFRTVFRCMARAG